MSKFIRAIFSILFVWFFCLLTIAFASHLIISETKDKVNIFLVITSLVISVLFLLYMYGKVGWWMHLYRNYFDFDNTNREDSFFRDAILPMLRSIVGYIGYVFQPLVLIIANGVKKKVLGLFCAMPMIVLSVACVLLAVNPSIVPELNEVYVKLPIFDLILVKYVWGTIAIIFLANAIFVFSIRKCVNCGSVVKDKHILETERKGESKSRWLSIDGTNVSIVEGETNGYWADKHYYEYYECKRCGHAENLTSTRKHLSVSENEYYDREN